MEDTPQRARASLKKRKRRWSRERRRRRREGGMRRKQEGKLKDNFWKLFSKRKKTVGHLVLPSLPEKLVLYST